MATPRRKLAVLLAAAVVLAAALAYFHRPKAPLLELVSPRQELPDYTERYPGDTSLSERVAKSYGIAMVLMQSPYTDRNVIALESVRSWAQSRFRQQPDFLHPVALEPATEPRQTIVDALFYNLFSPVRHVAETAVGEFLRARIAEFHETPAYASFRTAYFELFGFDGEAATLIARYQTERAKLAVPVILWALAWAAAVLAGVLALIRSRSRFDTLQSVLSCGWLLLSASYLLESWLCNQIPYLVASCLSALVGLYLRYPLAVRVEADSGALRIQPVSIGSNWLAAIFWVSLSLIAIQFFTWIRTGAPNDPDPVTLMISSVTGNFLQDPVRGKRYIMNTIGAIWLVMSIWTLTQLKGDARSARKVEEELASLQGPAT